MHISSADEIKKFTFLEDLHGTSTNTGSSLVCPYNMTSGLTPDETNLLVAEMLLNGLLYRSDDMTLKVGLTDEGKIFLQDGFCKRQDRIAFKKTVSERLLRWSNMNVEEGETIEVSMSSEELWFYGRVITLSDLEMAARDLEHHGLIYHEQSEPSRSFLVTLTAEGRECATSFGHDVDAYLQSKSESVPRPNRMAAAHSGSEPQVISV